MTNEEKFFYDWLLELESHNLANNIKYQPKTYLLADPVVIEYEKKLKTKTKILKKTLLQTVTYTPDFSFELSDKLLGVIYKLNIEEKSPILFKHQDTFIVDTKGTFISNNSDVTAPIKIKWTYQKYGEYVQIIKPFGDLFKNTFYPKSYFTLDSGKPRSKRIKSQLVPISKLKEYKTIDIWLKENKL